MSQKLKVNDIVKVISGAHKNETAKIVKIDWEKDLAYLEGIGTRERHLRKSYLNPMGGKKEVQLGIHVSNLKLEKAYRYEKPKKSGKAEKTDKKAKKGAK